MNTTSEFHAALDKFSWYHKIPVTEEYSTPGSANLSSSWDFIKKCVVEKVPMKGMSVIDVGCRDGLFSFFAENRNASVIHAIDNDINKGSEVLAKMIKSRVQFIQANLFDYSSTISYDIALFFGVLYHLRYPFNGIAKILSLLKQNGLLFIETALYIDKTDVPLLYCPYHDSPYEGTSVSFYNELGLARALESFGAKLDQVEYQPGDTTPHVRRAFCSCKKINNMENFLQGYWNGEHSYHSSYK